jgi:hypothetical protein
MLVGALAGAVGLAAAGAAAAAEEAGCGYIAKVGLNKTEIYGPYRDVKVLGGPEWLPKADVKPGKVVAIVCRRDSIVPVASDFRVPRQLGLPLYLQRDTPDTLVSVGLAKGAPSVTLIEGKWSEAEEAAIRAVVTQGVPSP